MASGIDYTLAPAGPDVSYSFLGVVLQVSVSCGELNAGCEGFEDTSIRSGGRQLLKMLSRSCSS